MPSKLTIIQGHPDSSRRHLCHALADAYADAAEQAGHEVRRFEIADIEFPMLRTQEEFNSGTLPAALKPAADAIDRADHIVLLFPLWLGTVPALAKAFLEQVMRPGVAFAYEKYGAKKLLAGHSARIVVTLGMPVWLIGHSIAATAFVGCAATYSSLSDSRRSEQRCSEWSRTRLRASSAIADRRRWIGPFLRMRPNGG
jgi:putative NADPH-quinone reductase